MNVSLPSFSRISHFNRKSDSTTQTYRSAMKSSQASKEFAEDSVSFLHAMLHFGETSPTESTRPPILHSAKVIRDGDWKLINTKGSRGFNAPKKVKYPIALYNLKEDLSETSNLAEKMPEKVDELKAKIERIIP